MNRDSLKKLMLREIMEESIRILRNSAKTKSMLEINYFEGRLNEVIHLYQSLFNEPIPEPILERVVKAWDSVTEGEERERENK